MKQAILTKYLGPTATRGARVKAWCFGGQRIVTWDYSMSSEANHHYASEQLGLKLNWREFSTRMCGALPDGSGYCFVQVTKDGE